MPGRGAWGTTLKSLSNCNIIIWLCEKSHFCFRFFFSLHYYYFWPGRRLLGKVLKYNPCTISKGWKLPQTLQCNIVMTFKSAEWFESSVGLCEILLSFLLLLYLPALVKVRTLRRLSKSTDGRPLQRVRFRTASVWCAFCCFANSVIVIQTGNVFRYVRRPLGPLSLWKKKLSEENQNWVRGSLGWEGVEGGPGAQGERGRGLERHHGWAINSSFTSWKSKVAWKIECKPTSNSGCLKATSRLLYFDCSHLFHFGNKWHLFLTQNFIEGAQFICI